MRSFNEVTLTGSWCLYGAAPNRTSISQLLIQHTGGPRHLSLRTHMGKTPMASNVAAQPQIYGAPLGWSTFPSMSTDTMAWATSLTHRYHKRFPKQWFTAFWATLHRHWRETCTTNVDHITQDVYLPALRATNKLIKTHCRKRDSQGYGPYTAITTRNNTSSNAPLSGTQPDFRHWAEARRQLPPLVPPLIYVRQPSGFDRSVWFGAIGCFAPA